MPYMDPMMYDTNAIIIVIINAMIIVHNHIQTKIQDVYHPVDGRNPAPVDR